MQEISDLSGAITRYDDTKIEYRVTHSKADSGIEYIGIFITLVLAKKLGISQKVGELRFNIYQCEEDETHRLFIIGMDNYTSNNFLKESSVLRPHYHFFKTNHYPLCDQHD